MRGQTVTQARRVRFVERRGLGILYFADGSVKFAQYGWLPNGERVLLWMDGRVGR